MTAAAWAWIGLPLFIIAFVAVFDLWAQARGVPTMSAQIHQWMQDQLVGPLVVGGLAGTFGGLLWHFVINR